MCKGDVTGNWIVGYGGIKEQGLLRDISLFQLGPKRQNAVVVVVLLLWLLLLFLLWLLLWLLLLRLLLVLLLGYSFFRFY